MYIDTQCIVIKETPQGENSLLLTALTPDRGVIRISSKGARKISGSTLAISQLFAYSSMTLYVGKNDFYTLSEGKLIENFYELRNDITSLSLGCWLCDCAAFVSTVGNEAEGAEHFRLLLNSLWALCKAPERHAFIKAVYELRLLFDAGFRPDFCCSECGDELASGSFELESGFMYCKNCKTAGEKTISPNLMKALKYIAASELKRLFMFSIGEKDLEALQETAEKFLLYRVECSKKSLEYYKSTIV